MISTGLFGSQWFAGVRVSVRCAASVTYSNPCLWSLKTRMRKPTNSATETISRMRWPRPTAGWHCALSGIRGVVNLLGKVPNKQSVDKLECWIWDQVCTKSAISVLSLAMCMVLDVVFPVNGRRCHHNCWAGALVANLLAALGVARLCVASRYAHPPRWACRVLRMLPPRWLQEVSDSSSVVVSRMRDACSARFPADGFGTSIVCVLAGHSGQAGQKEDVWHGSESFRTPACVVVHKRSRWNEAEVPDPAPVSWVCFHAACDVV